MKNVFLIVLLTCTSLSFSQNEFQIETNLGMAFQKKTTLNNEQLESKGGLGARLGVNYLRKIYSDFNLETGLFLKYSKGKYEIETVAFKYATLRVQVPLYASYKINDLWKINVGASIENNKDFKDLAVFLKDNLRYDMVTKIIYTHSTLLDFSLYANSMLTNTAAINTLTSPRNGIYLGAIFKLPNKKTNKED